MDYHTKDNTFTMTFRTAPFFTPSAAWAFPRRPSASPPMLNASQIKEGVFQLVVIFLAIAVAYVCVSDDGLDKKTVVLSHQFEANNSALCISAKSYNISAIKLLFCTRDVEVTYSTTLPDIPNGEFYEEALKPVKIKEDLNNDEGEGKKVREFFKAVDCFPSTWCQWHFTDRTFSSNQNLNQTKITYRSKTVHLSPFVSVCFQPCETKCFDVTSKLVVNPFFTIVFFACLVFALILRVIAHRYWMLLSTTVISVALPCILIFFLANKKASGTVAGIMAFGGWGVIIKSSKNHIWNFIKQPIGMAVLVIYIAAIIAANHFLPKPQYSQKSAVAWLVRVVCAAVVLVVSPQSSVPKHELQNGIPESSQIPSGMILALVLLLLCKVFDSFSFGADIPSDEAQLEGGDSPAAARTSAIKSDQPHTAKTDRARSPLPHFRESFASPPVAGAGDMLPFPDANLNMMFEKYMSSPEEWG
jgi:hypothetical protein